MKKQRLLVACGLIVGLLTLAGCDSLYSALYQDFLEQQYAAAAAMEELAAASPSFLYTLTATTGTLVADGGEEGAYTLTLRGLIGNVISFSDRPQRLADHESLADFVADWETLGFTDNPPNAALVLHEEDDSQDVLVVELRDPVYDANADTLTFAATVLADEQTGALAEYSEKADAALPAAFNTCSVLIDDARAGCSIQIWLDVYTSDDLVYVDNIMRSGPQTETEPYSVWLSTGQSNNLGDNVTAFRIVKYSSPGSGVTINFTGGADTYALSLSVFLEGEPPAGFTRDGTWTAPYNPLAVW